MAAAAINVFAKCNKAESIGMLRQHLVRKPNDVEARWWMAEAHVILASGLPSYRGGAAIEFGEIASRLPSGPDKETAASLSDHYSSSVTTLHEDSALISSLTAIVDRYPKCHRAWYWLGNASPYVEMKESCFRNAVQLHPSNFWYRTLLAEMMIAMNRPAEAEYEYYQALQLNKNVTLAHQGICKSILQQKVFDTKSAQEIEYHLAEAQKLNAPLTEQWQNENRSELENFKSMYLSTEPDALQKLKARVAAAGAGVASSVAAGAVTIGAGALIAPVAAIAAPPLLVMTALSGIVAVGATTAWYGFTQAVPAAVGAAYSSVLLKHNCSAGVSPGAGPSASHSSTLFPARAMLQRLKELYPKDDIFSNTLPRETQKNVKLAGQRHPRTGIVFDYDGFPIFDDVALFDTRIAWNIASKQNEEAHKRAATLQLRDYLNQKHPHALQLKAKLTNCVGNNEESQRTCLDEINKASPTIPGFTWHHHQDTGRMQLVPAEIHRLTGHVGGNTMWFGTKLN